MKSLFFAACLLTLTIGCKKSNDTIKTANNDGQILEKIVKTTIYGSVTTSESIDYTYDGSGKIISEGGKRYTRDEKGRITNISIPPNSTNRTSIDVFYSDINSSAVAYTICKIKVDNVSGTDSSVYQRDNNGRIIKIDIYFSQNGNPFFYDRYYKLMYDENNNLSRIERYNMVGDIPLLCEVLSYKTYDDKINPAWSDDEARILVSSESFLNTAKNNIISANGNYSKSHTYRSDGKPLFCKVFDGGTEVCRLDYYYN